MRTRSLIDESLALGTFLKRLLGAGRQPEALRSALPVRANTVNGHLQEICPDLGLS